MTLRCRVLSDLHFEFHDDGGRAFVESLDNRNVDVLIVAGDLTTQRHIRAALRMLCDRFRRVVYVLGNHEFYHSSLRETYESVLAADIEMNNLAILDCDAVTIDDVRFVGCPLWFRRSDADPSGMNDFRLIRDFESWVYAENARCIDYLERTVRPGDVVVTHYLPSQRSVAPRYIGSPLNPFFVCDVGPLIFEQQPALWVHGHTHDSCDYRIGATRVVCNPFGYKDHEENPRFDAGLTVEIP